MNFFLLSAALFLQSASADFNADISNVNSAASVLSSKVNAWNSNSGLGAALGIQGYFPTLSNAVASLSKDAASLSDADVDVNTISSFASSITNVLGTLTSKANDFNAVGAKSIVKGDLQSLGGPAVSVVDDIINAVKDDCDKVKSLTSVIDNVTNGFVSANSAYGASQLTFSKAPSC